MEKQNGKNKLGSKTDSQDGVLMATGLLTEAALLESMTKSKTLTVMVAILLSLFGLLLWFLFKMA